jgi:hypothetical protein
MAPEQARHSVANPPSPLKPQSCTGAQGLAQAGTTDAQRPPLARKPVAHRSQESTPTGRNPVAAQPFDSSQGERAA